ncbi:uncharacterized protein [Onthophagus taurus]|uniref:uncharacterized protein n=1 Tax=Onthophagus taurus TaxID=166361 RepID=UPI000C2081D5|nr:uncharacterized protein LOC111417192 [Onthophagus taurus]
MNQIFYFIFALLVPSSISLDPSYCTEQGQVCSSCNELAYCLESPEGFEIDHMGYCDEGKTCLRRDCTEEKNPLCQGDSNLAFPCHDEGMFPDPYDCHKYHFCVKDGEGNLVHYPATCSKGYGYDYDRLACTKKLRNNVCEDWPIDLCTNLGETKAFSADKSYFYVCADYDETNNMLYPHLYVCPNGGSYDNYKCSTTIITSTESTPPSIYY